MIYELKYLSGNGTVVNFGFAGGIVVEDLSDVTSQNIQISAPEEIAYKNGWINKEELLKSAEKYGKSPYGQHLKNVADGKLQY